MIVHPVARRTGEHGERVVEARLAEETKATEALVELGTLIRRATASTRSCLPSAGRAAAREAAERELFPALAQHCDRAELEQMAGPFVAMADKVRDQLAG